MVVVLARPGASSAQLSSPVPCDGTAYAHSPVSVLMLLSLASWYSSSSLPPTPLTPSTSGTCTHSCSLFHSPLHLLLAPDVFLASLGARSSSADQVTMFVVAIRIFIHLSLDSGDSVYCEVYEHVGVPAPGRVFLWDSHPGRTAPLPSPLLRRCSIAMHNKNGDARTRREHIRRKCSRKRRCRGSHPAESGLDEGRVSAVFVQVDGIV